MKNNLDFIQQYSDAHDSPGHKMLRVKYGWEGEGKYSALQGMIAKAEGCILDLNLKQNKGTLALDLGFSFDELFEFLQYLKDECGLLINNDGKITTEEIQETYSMVSRDREKARQRKERGKVQGTKPLFLENSDEKLKSSPNSPRTLKESKVEESKGKESKEGGDDIAPPPDFLKISFDEFYQAFKIDKEFTKFDKYNLEIYFSQAVEKYPDEKSISVLIKRVKKFIKCDVDSNGRFSPHMKPVKKTDSVSVAYELVKNNLNWIKSLPDQNPDEVIPELIKKCNSPATKDTLFEAYVEKAFKYYLAN